MDDPTLDSHLLLIVVFARPDNDTHAALAVVRLEDLDAFLTEMLALRSDGSSGPVPSHRGIVHVDSGLEDLPDRADFWFNHDLDSTEDGYALNTIVTGIIGVELGRPVYGNVVISGEANLEERSIANTPDWVVERLAEMRLLAYEPDGETRITMKDLLAF